MTQLSDLSQRAGAVLLGLVAAGGFALPAAAADCPDWRIDGIVIQQDAETAWSPQSFPLTAGGGLDLSQCGTVPGYGNLTLAPSFTVHYDDRGMGRDLDFRVTAECDTLMLVNDAGAGWHFNDDEDGTLDPRIRLAAAPSGIYDVWVGTFGAQACPATLILETFPPGPAPTCPDWSLGGAEMRLTPGSAEIRDVVAGGPLNLFANACGTGGHGHVAQAPDFTLYIDAQDSVGRLELAASGECDTLMLVNDPMQGWHFNDDHNGLDPMVGFAEAVPGRYDVWVGTYGDALCQASFSASWIVEGAVQPDASK